MKGKKIICWLVIVMFFLLTVQTLSLTRGEADENVRPFAELNIIPSNTSGSNCQFCGFNGDGSFYMNVWSDTFDGLYTRIILISPNLNIIWNRSFNYVNAWAVDGKGAIAVSGGDPDTGTSKITVIEKSGKDRWAIPSNSYYNGPINLQFTANGSVLLGCKEYGVDNSTVAELYSQQGGRVNVPLPIELKNTTLPVKLSNGTLTAQDDKNIYGLTSELTVAWRIPLVNVQNFYAYMAVGDDRIVRCFNNMTWVGDVLMNDGGLYCHDLDGDLLWRYPSGISSEYFYYPYLSNAGDHVFVLSQDTAQYYPYVINLTAFWLNGTRNWDYSIDSYRLSLPVLFKDGMALWNGTNLIAINGNGQLAWAANLTMYEEHPYDYDIPTIVVGPTDLVYLIHGDRIYAVGDYHEPEKPMDWSYFLMVPILIAILILAVYMKGKGMKDDED